MSDEDEANKYNNDVDQQPGKRYKKLVACANKAFHDKNYEEAIRRYTQAIEAGYRSAHCFGNRAAAFLKMKKYDEAETDCCKAMTLKKDYVEAYIIKARCHFFRGSLDLAGEMLEKAKLINPHHKTLAKEFSMLETILKYESAAGQAYSRGDHKQVECYARILIALSPGCDRYKVGRAYSLVLMGEFTKALDQTSSVLLVDEKNSDAWYVRALCFNFQGRFQSAYIAIVGKALKYNPDHERSRAIAPTLVTMKRLQDDARRAFENGMPQLAHRLYSEALDIDPMNQAGCANIYYKMGFMMCTSKMLPEAIMDLTRAIDLDGGHLKARLLRAKCYSAFGQYERAGDEYLKLYAMTSIPGYYRSSEEAYNARRNLYFALYTLSLTEDCSALDVEEAFRREAGLHHPGRHPVASDEVKEREEEKFKEIILCRNKLGVELLKITGNFVKSTNFDIYNFLRFD
ncbi:dnaJ homolog subfamily C member 7-like isoform X2 [Dendronephthya gigantea]|nr:dnaJ homolog subfamily C member 7-like isoform X2 [Dendronephthya gigantea]